MPTASTVCPAFSPGAASTSDICTVPDAGKPTRERAAPQRPRYAHICLGGIIQLRDGFDDQRRLADARSCTQSQSRLVGRVLADVIARISKRRKLRRRRPRRGDRPSAMHAARHGMTSAMQPPPRRDRREAQRDPDAREWRKGSVKRDPQDECQRRPQRRPHVGESSTVRPIRASGVHRRHL